MTAETLIVTEDLHTALLRTQVEKYPTEIEKTGHYPDTIHPPLYHLREFPENPIVLTQVNSEEVQKLNALPDATEEQVLVELIPEALIESAINSMASTLKEYLESNTSGLETVFSHINIGGEWLHDEMIKRFPSLIVDDDINVRWIRTKGKKLATLEKVIGYDDRVHGKRVVVFEDLMDSGETLKEAVDDAYNHGAQEVVIVTLVNKLETKKKVLVPEVQIIGVACPDLWIVGCGADVMEEIGRDFRSIFVSMSLNEWEYHLSQKEEKFEFASIAN